VAKPALQEIPEEASHAQTNMSFFKAHPDISFLMWGRVSEKWAEAEHTLFYSSLYGKPKDRVM
jgi:hypothetical protein